MVFRLCGTCGPRRYGDRVKRFATFNEACVFTLFGYGLGWNAPGLADKTALHKAIHHVNLSHGRAAEVLRAAVQHASIGAIHNRQPCFPSSGSDEDREAALRFAEYWNDAFPYPQHFGYYPKALATAIEPFQKPGDMALIAQTVDWFGLNHYSPHYIKADANWLGATSGVPPANVPSTSIGWPIVPGAFRDTLLDIHARFRLPIYVLENGTAADDKLDSTGALLRELLDGEGVASQTFAIAGETREDFFVSETRTGQQYRFILPGPQLNEAEWQECLKLVSSIEPFPRFVVASGSLPAGVPDDFYARIARIARQRGARMILDTSGRTLTAAVDEGVDLIKPNLREMRELSGSEPSDAGEWEGSR